MDCIQKTELEQFLKGKLAPERMLAVDEHVTGCTDCRATLVSLPARADFGAAILGATDCPEYEELSAYTDATLDAQRTDAIRAHANLCELCAKDLDRIRELRSHATLRGKVTVRPGMTRQKQKSPLGYWKQALAGVSFAGLVTIAVLFGHVGSLTVQKEPRMASNPQTVREPVQPSHGVAPPKPAPPAPLPGKTTTPTTVAATPTPAPTVAPVLKDGKYAVIRSNGHLELAKIDGTSVRTALEARVAASIDQKLKTGKIHQGKPMQVAVLPENMRDDNAGYEVSPTAPKQIAPLGKISLSTSPTFAWSAVDLAESYRVRVYTLSGNLVLDQMSRKTTLTASKPLPRGQVYKWRVGVRFGETDQWVESAAVRFAVLSAQDYASIKQTQKSLPGSHLALGATYESLGLYDEAASEYRALRRQNPDSKLAQKLLYGAAQR